MSKPLEEMSLEELWELFPIFLVEPNKHWNLWFEEEKENIISLLPKDSIIRISHIGSTAIDSIWAKNIVDILLEAPSQTHLSTIKTMLLSHGWLCMNESPTRVTLNKGYTTQGFAERVFHLHIRIIGDNDELYFRDFLNNNPGIAKEYETLKLSLWKQYEHNRDAYTEAKGPFIKQHTETAKEQYHNRY